MKIAVVTTSRFHLLDLARELCHLGHDVAFYSILPKGRIIQFGLPASCSRGGFFVLLLPLLVLQHLTGRFLSHHLNLVILKFVDWLVAQRLEPCDVFIGLSGLSVVSARKARNRFGAKILIERGSRHILSQKSILDQLQYISFTSETVPHYAVVRELASYQLSDFVVLPSRHVLQSFLDFGFAPENIFINPYGVDIDMFSPTPAPSHDSAPTVLYVGAWSFRKGCDLLVRAVEMLGARVKLLHVGPIGDAPLPSKEWFVHQDPVPQAQLRDWYAKADVFVLASREEGLALVQAQALACGLPIVCTDRTGGEDLKTITGLKDEILVVPHDNPDAIAAAIADSIKLSRDRFAVGESRDLIGIYRDRLTWHSYGKRYSNFLLGLA